MRVTRVFVDLPLATAARVALPPEAAGYLLRVLRLRAGDACVLFNGDGNDYDARLIALDKRHAQAEVVEARGVANESPLRIVLLQGIARGEKMDLILQKATELGVAGVHPVDSERSEVRLQGERMDKRLAHWRGVVAAACGQCGRARLPDVLPPASLDSALASLPPLPRFLLDPGAGNTIGELDAIEGCVLAVGPEGGWSARDREQLHASGFTGLRLGPRVLRTETAGIAAIAALQSRFGDL